MIIGVILTAFCCSLRLSAQNVSGEQCFESPTKPGIVHASIAWTVTGQTVTIRTTFAKTFVDNTYGSGAVGWPNGHTFSNLTGSDNLQLALYDANGLKKLEFKQDYITASAGAPSGYDCLGVTGGEGQMILGSASNIVSATSSLDQNMNTFGYVLNTNSPATNSSYAPNASYPNWNYDVYYEVTVNLSAFGAAGFGYPLIASIHASPSKTGNNTEIVLPVNCPNTLEVSVSGNCVQDCSEGINLTVNSTHSPFSYLWSNGATTQDISGLCAGAYAVTVTDANSNTLTASAQVTDATCPGGEQCFSSPTIPDIANAHSEWTINGAANTVTIRTTFAKTFVDNTYGTNAIGWNSGHTFSNLVGSDNLQIALYDANGSKKVEFKQDYITASAGTPSGYDCLGVAGGEGQMILGNASSVLSASSSLDHNMNTFGYVLTTNSPSTNSTYSPNASYPNWIYEVYYEVTVDLSVFGSAGFGYPDIVSVHASPSKTGNNTEPVIETECPQTLTLTATGESCSQECSGSITLTVNSFNAPFTYLWSNGATTKDIANLCPEDYSVTVTDADGTTATATANVKEANCDGGQQCFSSPTIPDIANARSQWTINGNILTIRTTFAKTFVDNTYGTNAIGWNSGHTFSNLVGSDHIQLALYDVNGIKKLEFKQDYITSSAGAPSGYDCLGVSGGEGQMILGNASSIVSATTSLDQNMNTFGYVLTSNSPATNGSYAPNGTYPNWIYDVWYEISVDLSVFGSAGFGYPRIASVHASPSKTGNNTELVNPDDCPVDCSNSTLSVSGQVRPDLQCDTLPPPADCNCSCAGGGLKTISVMFVGVNGSNVNVYASSGQHDLIASFTNVQFGDILFVDGTSLPGGKLFKKTYFKVVGGKETKIYTDCKKDIKGKTYNAFKVVGFMDALGNSCDALANCDQCPCYKYFKQITLMYNGNSGASISVYEDASHTKLIASYANVQEGGVLVIEKSNKNLPKIIYISVNGGTHLVLTSECNKIGIGGTYGAFTLVGFIDKKGRECSFSNPCDGDGSINLTATGGIPPYSFEWSNGSSSEDLSDLCSGSFSVTVTDSIGCSITATYNVGTAPCALAAIGDFVWHDLNANGQQDAGEPGISGVTVQLYDADNDSLLSTIITDANGYYLFDSLDLGNYYIIFGHATVPNGLLPTLADVGNDATDSDADAITGKTGIYSLNSGDTILTVDAGYRCSLVACSISGETVLCPSATSTYSGPAGVSSYSWTIVGNGNIVGASNQQTVTVKAKNNCGSFTLMLVSSIGTCAANCEYIVAVEDQTPPTATISDVPETVECPAQPVFGEITVTDNCDLNPTYATEDDTIAGNCPNSFIVVRTWHIADACGNSSSASQAVTVMDNTAPVIHGVGDDATINCPEIPEFSNPTASDACGSVTLTYIDDVTFGSCPYSFSITRTWTAADACGNTATAAQTILAIDNTAPLVSGIGADETIQCPTQPQFSQPVVSDECDSDPVFTFSDDTIAGNCPNAYTVIRSFIATDACGNSSSASQAITVVDATAPVISGVGADETIQCPAIPQFSHPAATDACGIATLTYIDDITFGACGYEFNITRIWTATDACGNTSTASQTITVEDNTAPVISGVGANATIQCPAQPQFSQPVANDECDGASLTHQDFRTNGSCANEYSVTRVWTTSDACGNSSTASQTITVVDNVAPVISSVGADETIECPAQPQFSEPVAFDACGNISSFTFEDELNEGACANEYAVTRVWTTTDVCGNSSTASQTISVIDNSIPVISGIGADEIIYCSEQPQFSEPTASDLCGTATLTFSDATIPGNCANERIVIREWRATDACGNSSSATQAIAIIDNVAPVISNVNPDMVIACPEIPDFSRPAATDACGTATLTFLDDITFGDCGYEFSITRIWTATDACGNTSTAAQTITARDTTAPVISGVGDDETILCPAQPEFSQPVVIDECDFDATISFDDDTIFDNAPQSIVFVRTWTASDACGNLSESVSQRITVLNQQEPATGENPACSYSCDGSVSVSGGCYSYLWSTGDVTATVVNLCAGEYTVTMTDMFGYQMPDTVLLVAPLAIEIESSVDHVSCFGASDGSINLLVSGGTSPYIFHWSNGRTTEDVSGLIAGTYSVTVTDENGCTAVEIIVVTQPSALVLGAIATPSTCELNDGEVAVTVTGSIPPYTFFWSTGATTQNISGLAPGIYTVTVTDAHGCLSTVSSEVIAPAQCCELEITGFTLVNFGFGGDIDTIIDTYVINRDTLCTFNVRADVCGDTVKSVKFIVNGNLFRVEERIPFALAGDNPQGDYHAWQPVPGTYLIEAIPYNGPNATGIAGASKTITITIVDGPGINTSCICNDNNLCTIDEYVNLTCTNTPIVCDDNDACTINGCANGTCLYTPVNCDDSNLCTVDACVNGSCLNTAIECFDNDACTSDACVNGECEFTAIICDDANACTTDACENGNCVYTAIVCDDSDACTTDACVDGECVYTAIVCDDANACTTDACVDGACEFTAIVCDDNDACTTDACENGECIYTAVICDDSDACTIDACVDGACESTAIVCDDNDACTTDACVDGDCVFTAIICGDNNACTTDACENGECNYTPVLCNDHNDCTSDVCENGACVYTVIACDDANECTTDACQNGNCVYTEIICDDNDACTNDKCEFGQCEFVLVNCSDEDLCTTDACINGICSHETVLCDDDDMCTTQECVAGECQFTPINCDDSNACTTDACFIGQCINTPVTIEVTHETTDITNNCSNTQNQLCVLNFAGLPHGTKLNEQYAAYGIHISGQAYPNTWVNQPNISQLIIFDTYVSGSWDPDLQVDMGNVAIFPEDTIDANNNGLVDFPNDTRWGGKMILTFDFARTVQSVKIIDHDRAGGSITAYDAANNVITTVAIPIVADGGVAVVNLNVSNVRKLVIDDMDSGGVTDIVFDCQQVCCDGTTEVFANGGSAPYSYNWSNGATTASVDSLCEGTYFVTVTDANGCVAFDTIIINPASQIGFRNMQTEFEDMGVYPMPFDNMLNVEFTSKNEGPAQIRLLNLLGQVLQKENVQAEAGHNAKALNVSGTLAQGFYFVELYKDGYSEGIRVLKIGR